MSRKQRHASHWVDLIEVAPRVGVKLAGLTLSGRRLGAAISIPSSKSNSCRVPRGSDPEDLSQGLMLMCVMCRLASMFGHGDQSSAVRTDLRSRSFQRNRRPPRLTRSILSRLRGVLWRAQITNSPAPYRYLTRNRRPFQIRPAVRQRRGRELPRPRPWRRPPRS
jgi:hypothetical protein